MARPENAISAKMCRQPIANSLKKKKKERKRQDTVHQRFFLIKKIDVIVS